VGNDEDYLLAHGHHMAPQTQDISCMVLLNPKWPTTRASYLA